MKAVIPKPMRADLWGDAKGGCPLGRARHDRQWPCYNTSKAFTHICRRYGLKHVRIRPYTPKTNGKAERFIQTALHEWAYAVAYPNSDLRAARLPQWLHSYNWHRPHGSLNSRPPFTKIGLTEDNLLRPMAVNTAAGCNKGSVGSSLNECITIFEKVV